MPTALVQGALSNSLPQLLVLQILQLLVEWQNPNNISFSKTLNEATRQCPLQRSKFIQLATECGRIQSTEVTSEEIVSTIQNLLESFNDTSRYDTSQNTKQYFNDRYINVNLGEALSESNDLVEQLKVKIRELEMKQLTEMETRLEYEAELLRRIEDQQAQLENLRLQVEQTGIENPDSQQTVILALIKQQYASANSVRIEAECARGTTQLAEIMKTNFMNMDDRLFGVEKAQIQNQRILAGLKFKDNDERDLETENEDLKDKIEKTEEDLKNSTDEISSIREELSKKNNEVTFLKTRLEDLNTYTDSLERRIQEQNNCENKDPEDVPDVSPMTGNPTSLLEAVNMGDVDSVRSMLQSGMDPNVRDFKGWTVLHRSAEKGDLEIVKLLVQHGADLYTHVDSHSGDLPIHTAAVNGRDDIMYFMLERGVPVDVRNNLGTTPMLASIWDDYFPLVRMLVEVWGADVNAQIYNLDNRTGLHLTALYGYDEITGYLVEQRANLELRTSGNCSAHQPEHDNDYDNEHCDKMSETPLHWAARYNKWNVAEILVANGADMTAKDGAGRTPHEVARSYGHLEMAHKLEVSEESK